MPTFPPPRARRSPRVRLLAASSLWLSLLAAPSGAPLRAADNPQDAPVPPSLARLTVDASQPGLPVSPQLYGIFFEEINRAGDGGLYAEMLQNRSFEDSADLPLGWTAVKSPNVEAKISLDKSHPLNANNPTALRLEITKLDGLGLRAGISNAGFKGVPENPREQPRRWMNAFERAQSRPENGLRVEQGKQYRLSVYARSEGQFSVPLTASLETADGKALATQKITGVGADWKKFECVLSPSATERDARLVVSAAQPGVVYLDMVSLFPKDTFKGRENGLRADLAQKVADLKPAFMRFPGGCFVEGDRIADAFRWKKSIGDIAERPGHWNLWGYYSNDGLGYHEYLQYCEDIGAEPLYVFNVGMAHKDHVEMGKMDEWVQDTMDAIEYANGPADSKWGSLRAKAGHPAPFNLKYLEIGNENGGRIYDERYALFYDAIHAKYPEMHLIADEWQGLPRSRPVQMIDSHFYGNPAGMRARATQFDKYDRKGPKVYFGEYAVTTEAGTGNLQAAIAEAAFMTGLERNADVVKMASYAPLFVNPSWKSWNPNAIVFDSERIYGTPSYYVQKMFAENRPDDVLPIVLEQNTPPPPVKKGLIGVGTWETQAEYKDLQVTRASTGEVIFDGAKAPAADWKLARGAWQIADGVLRQTGTEDDARAVTGDAVWDDCVFSLKARKLSGNEGFLIIFQSQGGREKNWWNIGGWGNTQIGLEGGLLPEDRVDGHIETGRWYDIRVELRGPSVKCYLDGKLIHDVTRASQPALFVSAGRKNDTGEVILKVVNASENSQQINVNVFGAGAVSPVAKTWTLTSDGPFAENAFDAPEKVVPKEGQMNELGVLFRKPFPPHSVTILRLKTEAKKVEPAVTKTEGGEAKAEG